MLRFVSLNPRVFIELLVQAGCKLGIRRRGMQHLYHPGNRELEIVVRMGEAVDTETLLLHLSNLGISESRFRELLDRYRPARD